MCPKRSIQKDTKPRAQPAMNVSITLIARSERCASLSLIDTSFRNRPGPDAFKDYWRRPRSSDPPGFAACVVGVSSLCHYRFDQVLHLTFQSRQLLAIAPWGPLRNLGCDADFNWTRPLIDRFGQEDVFSNFPDATEYEAEQKRDQCNS